MGTDIVRNPTNHTPETLTHWCHLMTTVKEIAEGMGLDIEVVTKEAFDNKKDNFVMEEPIE